MSSETLPVKGQETKLSFISPNGLDETVTKIKECSFTFDMEIITEQYLSETADQFDDIFRGCSVEATFDLTDPKVYDMVQLIIDRAQRRTPATGVFSITSTLNFPTGKKRRLLFSNLRFGEVPTNIGGRDEYAEMKLTAKCSGFRKL